MCGAGKSRSDAGLRARRRLFKAGKHPPPPFPSRPLSPPRPRDVSRAPAPPPAGSQREAGTGGHRRAPVAPPRHPLLHGARLPPGPRPARRPRRLRGPRSLRESGALLGGAGGAPGSRREEGEGGETGERGRQAGRGKKKARQPRMLKSLYKKSQASPAVEIWKRASTGRREKGKSHSAKLLTDPVDSVSVAPDLLLLFYLLLFCKYLSNTVVSHHFVAGGRRGFQPTATPPPTSHLRDAPSRPPTPP